MNTSGSEGSYSYVHGGEGLRNRLSSSDRTGGKRYVDPMVRARREDLSNVAQRKQLNGYKGRPNLKYTHRDTDRGTVPVSFTKPIIRNIKFNKPSSFHTLSPL